MPQAPVSVVIIDDHAITRMGLTFVLRTFEGIQLLGEAANDVTALKLCADKNPDVALVDMLLVDQEGPEVIRALRQQQPALRILAISSFDNSEMIGCALDAGAVGYILKSISAVDLAEAIRRTAQNIPTFLPESVALIAAHIRRSDQP
jgi:two-component system, NarL family, response regulator LiaR